MKKIYLKGKHSDKFALVDDEVYENLSEFSWYLTQGYARRKLNTGNFSYMHTEVMNGAKGVDHINHNGLDNRRENLRMATRSQNQCNRKAFNDRKYKGVSFHKRDKKYYAQIVLNGKNHYIGAFKTEIEAAKAYNEKALDIHGEFSCLNEIEGE